MKVSEVKELLTKYTIISDSIRNKKVELGKLENKRSEIEDKLNNFEICYGGVGKITVQFDLEEGKFTVFENRSKEIGEWNPIDEICLLLVKNQVSECNKSALEKELPHPVSMYNMATDIYKSIEEKLEKN